MKYKTFSSILTMPNAALIVFPNFILSERWRSVENIKNHLKAKPTHRAVDSQVFLFLHMSIGFSLFFPFDSRIKSTSRTSRTLSCEWVICYARLDHAKILIADDECR